MGMLAMRRRLMKGKKVPFDTNGYGFVDMGEAGIWATCNVGANSPEEAGYYFAWGETEPKEEYSWNTYKFGTTDNLSKYNKEDGLTELLPEDDVTHVWMGGDWRMPKEKDFLNLIEYCNRAGKTNYNGSGINVLTFTLKTDPSKILVFPIAGHINQNTAQNVTSWGYYWSDNVLLTNLQCASGMNVSTSKADTISTGSYRYLGRSVRAIIGK